MITLLSVCPECHRGLLTVQRHHKGEAQFIGCTYYPSCRFTADYDAHIHRLNSEIERLQKARRDPEPRGSAPEVQAAQKVVLRAIFDFHPDRNGDGLVPAEAVTKALNELRITLWDRKGL